MVLVCCARGFGIDLTWRAGTCCAEEVYLLSSRLKYVLFSVCGGVIDSSTSVGLLWSDAAVSFLVDFAVGKSFDPLDRLVNWLFL